MNKLNFFFQIKKMGSYEDNNLNLKKYDFNDLTFIYNYEENSSINVDSLIVLMAYDLEEKKVICGKYNLISKKFEYGYGTLEKYKIVPIKIANEMVLKYYSDKSHSLYYTLFTLMEQGIPWKKTWSNNFEFS